MKVLAALAALLSLAPPAAWTGARGVWAVERPAAAAAQTQTAAQEPAAPGSGQWRALEGSWSASGRRHRIAAEGGATAQVLFLSGAVVLTSSQGVSRGFRGEFVAFDDGTTLSAGRLAWTDEHGDRVFGSFRGAPLQPGGTMTVTLTGGTGRYSGITGELTLTWQYVVNTEDDAVQVRTTTLKGRCQFPGGRP